MQHKAIHKGVYIVIDPGMELKKIRSQLNKIKKKPIAAIQIWDNQKTKIKEELIEEIIKLFRYTSTPVLINNQWEYLKKYDLDGIHFDEIPDNMKQINNEIKREFIKGITLTNNLESLPKLEKMKFDYLSFCSIFPSSTSNSCEIVRLNTIEACSKQSKLPIFLSGGIKPDNLIQLKHLKFDGIAIVSGIMKAKDPKKAIENYINQLK